MVEGGVGINETIFWYGYELCRGRFVEKGGSTVPEELDDDPASRYT